MASCDNETFSRDNFRGRYNDFQEGGGGGLEGKCKKPLPTKPPHPAFSGNLPSDILLRVIDMLRDLKIKSVGLVYDSDTGEFCDEFDDKKCLEEALKYNWSLFCDRFFKEDISGSIQDSQSDAKRSVDMAKGSAILQYKEVLYAAKNADEARDRAKKQRKIVNDLEKDMKNLEEKDQDPIRCRRLQEFVDSRKRFAFYAEEFSLSQTRDLELAVKQFANKKEKVEMQKNLLVLQNRLNQN